MTSKFEQLIEYVINDEEAKAKELFHDIVVEKSREIYENLMQEEAEEELDEAAEEELDEAEEEEEIEEGAMGGDASDDLIDDVETEEESDISMEGEDDAEFDDEAEEAGDELTGDLEADHDEDHATKDDIMNLEDKLDQLMAEFEAAMGGGDMGDGDDFGADEGGDAIEVDDTEEMMPMAEAVSLKAAPKPTTRVVRAGSERPMAMCTSSTARAVSVRSTPRRMASRRRRSSMSCGGRAYNEVSSTSVLPSVKRAP